MGTSCYLADRALGCGVGVEARYGTIQGLFKEGSRYLFPPAKMRRIAARARKDFALWAPKLWKHRLLAPWRFRRAAAEDVNKWKNFGDDNGKSFENLKKELGRVGLSKDTLGSAEEFAGLAGSPYSREAVKPCTRATIYQNLEETHALAAVICNDPRRAISLWDGNLELIECMITQSGAVFRTNLESSK
jgi:hypothetical protein